VFCLNPSQTCKILFIGTQMTVGGAQRVLLQLANWFHHKGYAVTAVFIYDLDGLSSTWQGEYPFPIINLNAWQKGRFTPAKALPLLGGLIDLYRLMRKEKFTSVITFTHHSNLLGLPVAWLAGIRVRIATHRGRILDFPAWQERLHAWMVNVGIATTLVAVSEPVRQQCVEEGVNPSRVMVISNGVNLPEVSPASIQQARRELGLAENELLVLTAGRLHGEKGHDTLVAAMPAILAVLPNVYLALAGKGTLRETLEEQADRLGVAGNVHFLGVRSDVIRLIAAAELFALPSNSEGMPNALLEAMGLGTAIVATRVGGVPQVVEDGVNGVLVPPHDPPAMAAAIIDLLQNDEKRRRLAESGRTLVRQQYTLEKMCEQYEVLLNPGR
jgi:glycosyltransferase involved in cell wall biosynthesis